MNSFITYSAQAKLLSLITRVPRSVLIDVMGKQLTLDFESDSEITCNASSAIIVNVTPRVYATPSALNSLTDASVDFDYRTHNFILTTGQ
jgi:hypothetical protein